MKSTEYVQCIFVLKGEKDHFNINLEDEVVRGSIVVQNVS